MPFIKPDLNDPFGNSQRFSNSEDFKLMQWPIKLWKISKTAPFFHGAHLLIAGDCVGVAYPRLHEKLSPGHVPLICCPETDFDIATKLGEIISLNDIRSITVLRVDANCCADLVTRVQEAVRISKKPLPVQTTTIFIDAEEVD